MVAWFLCFFECCVFFSLDPNRPNCCQREKDGRPGPHDHSNGLPMNLIPHLGSRLVGETAMKTNRGDACLVITYQVCNPLGPFCFAHDNKDRLSTVEYQ